MNYTQGQLTDIKDRQDMVIAYFKEMGIQPMIQARKEMIQENVFADRLEVVLVDTKYLPEEKAEATEEPVIAEKINE
jgi:hypothetical protein